MSLILESAKKGDTLPGNPGAVDLSPGDGGPAQLTPTPVGIDTLLIRDISRSSAMQRAGRAGREVCVRPPNSWSF